LRTSDKRCFHFLPQGSVIPFVPCCDLISTEEELMKSVAYLTSGLTLLISLCATPAFAACGELPNYQALQQALRASVKASGGPANGGFDLHMWATIVDRDGIVCTVAFSGADRGAQWPGSRVISAQKANTANAFSLDGLALSTANLFSAVQPGHSLFGLQESNPVDPAVAYSGQPENYGAPNDPMTGRRTGGVNVFGGGLALYRAGKVVGAIGVSGDSSCADHNVAWRVRMALGLGAVTAGVTPKKDDGIIYDLNPQGNSASGWGHPRCAGTEPAVAAEIGAGG
jgi:uncharacterized protein GlcG (DUF336 family)